MADFDLYEAMRIEEVEGKIVRIIGEALEIQTLPPIYRIPDAFEPND